MRTLLAAAALSLLASGSAAAAADPTGPQAYHGARTAGPLPDASGDGSIPPGLPASTPAAYSGPQLGLQHAYIGRDAAEPTLGVDPSGTAYMTAGAFDAPPGLNLLARQEIKRSTDGGRSWQTIGVPFYAASGEPTTLDPYVWVDAVTGRVFALTLLGGGTYIAYSDDKGETWGYSQVSSPGFNDHQTLVTGPAPEGVPHAQTSDAFPNLVWYCVNHVSDSRCAISTDGGQVWQPSGGPAYAPGPNEGDDCLGGLHGHIDIDSEGRAFLPAGHCGLPVISISEDAGLTWKRVVVSKDIPAGEVHTAVGIDKADNLYYVWFDDKHQLPFMAVSTDHGNTWGEPIMVAPPGVTEVNFPEIVGGEAGRVALTFPGGTGTDKSDSQRPWYTYVVTSTNALDPNPTFHSNTAGPRNDPVHRGNCEGRCAGMFDFIDIQLSPLDGSVWATATDTCTPVNDCHIGDGGASDAEGVAVRSISGPWMTGDPVRGGDPRTQAPSEQPPTSAKLAPSARKVRTTCRRTSSRKASAVCAVRLKGAPGGTAVGLRLYRGKALVGAGRTVLKRGKGTMRIRTKRRLAAGRYSVLISVGRRGAQTTRAERRVRLK